MVERLTGKAVIVTGAGTGLGEAIAHRFAREGARVVVAGMPPRPVENVARAIGDAGGEAVAYVGDLSDERAAPACVELALEHYGRLDVLVSNASLMGPSAPVPEFPVDSFDRLLANNCRSTFLITRAALPHLRSTRGAIVIAGSSAALTGAPTFAAYAATKAWLHNFAISLALENAAFGVRVNAVAVGLMDTGWNQADAGGNDAAGSGMLDALPMGRMGTVEEMAAPFVLLASDEASYVTGSVWQVDGGFAVGRGLPGAAVPEALRQEPPASLPLTHTFDGLKDRWWTSQSSPASTESA